jgi:hypothetical protein
MFTTTNHKEKAEEVLKRFNEHGAKPDTVGYEIAKAYAVRGINFLIDETYKANSAGAKYYEAIKEEVLKL